MAGCCSALYFLNLKGDVLIQRTYRDDVEYVLPYADILFFFVSICWQFTF